VRVEFVLRSGTTVALDTAPEPQPQLPTVLFVPGYTGSKEDFMPLLRPLSQSGYRAVAVDQRGQFESSWASDESGYGMDALSADIAELAYKIRQSATVLHLVGHSFGGLVTRQAVVANPGLFDSFTLMGSGPTAIDGERRVMLDAMEPVLAHHGMPGLWAQIAERSQADPAFRQSPPALQEFLRVRFLANDPIGLRVMGNHLRSTADLTDELVQAGVRTLVLHGVDDDAWPPTVQADMASKLGASYSVISAAAHSPAVENPQGTLTALLNFWRDC
jgi:pimeloyl-ACP methyl ester carboxylesterase